MTSVTATPAHNEAGTIRAALPHVAPFLGILALAMILPFVSNDYWALIGTRAAIYWVLVSGLNLVVGFAGHLAIGYVALLTLGAYTTSVLVAGNVMPPVPVFAALPIAGCVGAVFGVIVGLPALRLRTFYFAMSTLGFATIVTQIALAWQSVTGGGIGIVGSGISGALQYARGAFTSSASRFAAFTTWMSANVARSRFGRALIAVRDAEVAAEATGISKPKMLIAIFLFAGALAAIAGGLFATPADLHHAGCLHLRPVRAVLHRDPDRRPRLDPGADARHHHPDHPAGDRGALGGVVDVPLRGVAAGDRAGHARRHRGAAGFSQPPSARQQPRHRAATGGAGRYRAQAHGRQHADAARHRAELRQCARHRWSRSRRGAGPDPRPDRPQRQRQDHDAQRDLGLLRRQGRNDDPRR